MTDNPLVRIDSAVFAYPSEPDEIVLRDVSLTLEEGSFTGLIGPSGAGKTTLCRLLAGFVPHHFDGPFAGTATIDGHDLSTATIGDLAASVGYVFESPHDQLTGANTTVFDEAAYALENLGIPADEIRSRVRECLDTVGIGHLADRHPQALSGGQCQRLALASVLAVRPKLLVLDEPTSQLDPLGSEEVVQVIARMHDRGITVVLCSQDVASYAPYADRLILMEEGRITADGDPRSVLRHAAEREAPVTIPEPVRIGLELRRRGAVADTVPVPLSVDEAAAELAPLVGESAPISPEPNEPAENSAADATTVRAEHITHVYTGGVRALDGLEVTLDSGCICLLGQNGAGKSTLAKHLNGLLKPTEGRVLIGDLDTREHRVAQLAQQVGLAFQNPDDQLFKRTVEEEVAFGAKNVGHSADRVRQLVDDALTRLDLQQLRHRNPSELSLAARKRVAVASVVAMDTPVLVLDEPTGAQDAPGNALLGRLVDDLTAAGKLVIAITHDVEFARRHATRIVVLAQGTVLLDGTPTEVFARPDVLAATFVLPPAGVRVGTAAGIPQPPLTTERLLDLLPTS
ncbi:ABC transporter ATP-binding protein [Streptomyces sp. NPDC058424]|uniref:ABC transporter ATP-binding protein n=1 Tax=Streptomyces sp. NPDC058424 TaxID=3346491 RepID=UPI003656A5BA